MKIAVVVCKLSRQEIYIEGDYIGVDRGAIHLIYNNYPLKIAIGDFDSVNCSELQLIKNQTKTFIKLNPVKDYSDLEYCLQYLSDNYEYDKIYCYGALGSRMDHTIANINLLYKFDNLYLIDSLNEISVLNIGLNKIEKGIYKYYSFFTNSTSFITLKGFQYDLDNYCLTHTDNLCLSNELLLDEGYVICDNKVVLVKAKD